jgi:hypothetical protein
MASRAVVEFQTIALHPSPQSRVFGFQTMFLEQLFDIEDRPAVVIGYFPKYQHRRLRKFNTTQPLQSIPF